MEKKTKLPREAGEHTSCCRATERNLADNNGQQQLIYLVVEQNIVVEILVAETPHELWLREGVSIRKGFSSLLGTAAL